VLDGGASRWRRDVHGPERLLEHALLRTPLRASVDPGTAEMDGCSATARPWTCALTPRLLRARSETRSAHSNVTRPRAY